MNLKTEDLKPGMIVATEVLFNNTILVEKDAILTSDLIEKIRKFRIEEVEIKKEDEVSIEEILKKEEVIKEKFSEDYKENIEKTKTVLEDALNSKIDDEVIDAIVDKTMENINQDSDILMGLMEMKDEEDFLFDHSLKSMMLALIFGKELNYSEKELDILGKAALLHDIGMMRIEREILHKTGTLTDEEMEKVRKHPLYAVEMLDGQDMEVIEVVKHHHERVDGTGYPSKLKDEEISEMAKVLKICDMYSALTSQRPYREAFSKNNAIKELVQSSGKEIDLVLFKKFLKIMSMFPVGSKVKLNNGKIATVAKITSNIFRPVIDIEEDGKIQRIDLSNDENFLIHIMGLA